MGSKCRCEIGQSGIIDQNSKQLELIQAWNWNRTTGCATRCTLMQPKHTRTHAHTQTHYLNMPFGDHELDHLLPSALSLKSYWLPSYMLDLKIFQCWNIAFIKRIRLYFSLHSDISHCWLVCNQDASNVTRPKQHGAMPLLSLTIMVLLSCWRVSPRELHRDAAT